jgi:dynein assembly factor 3
LESQATNIARFMLLLAIVLELPDRSLQEQAELFLEIYGNLLIRKKTMEWIQEKSTDLIRVITDNTGILSGVLDFQNLKFRERDDIEFVFKFWRDSSRSFDGPALWDIRLRNYLQRRYDSKDNIFDWDYNMKYLERNPNTVLSKPQYTKWRSKGIAFEVRESTYDCTNRTLATVDLLKQVGSANVGWCQSCQMGTVQRHPGWSLCGIRYGFGL